MAPGRHIMPANYQNVQKRLQAFDFTGLFTQELMWNRHVTRDFALTIDGVTYTLKPVAKRVMAVFGCIPPTDAEFPKYATRRKIDTQVSKTALLGSPFFRRNGNRMEPPHGRTICFVSDPAASFATCLLNSSLFYWLYSGLCDCEHINDSFVRQFPFLWDGHAVTGNTS